MPSAYRLAIVLSVQVAGMLDTILGRFRRRFVSNADPVALTLLRGPLVSRAFAGGSDGTDSGQFATPAGVIGLEGSVGDDQDLHAH